MHNIQKLMNDCLYYEFIRIEEYSYRAFALIHKSHARLE